MSQLPQSATMKVSSLSYRARLAATCRNAAEDAEGRAWAIYRAALLREVARELEAVEAEGRAEAHVLLGVTE